MPKLTFLQRRLKTTPTKAERSKDTAASEEKKKETLRKLEEHIERYNPTVTREEIVEMIREGRGR